MPAALSAAAILALTLALTACHPPAPPPASQYRLSETFAPLALDFAPSAARPTAAEAASLHAIAQRLPATTIPLFYATGPLAPARAAATGRELQRPVRLVLQPYGQPDQAVLAFPNTQPIVADACRGPGGRLPEDNWPGHDDNPVRLLPPGCAAAQGIAAQTTAQSDLLRGRPLPPGAALPYAQAIDLYDQRNNGRRPSAEQQGGQGSGEGPGSTDSAGMPAGSGAPAGNPLLGPVPQSQPGQH